MRASRLVTLAQLADKKARQSQLELQERRAARDTFVQEAQLLRQFVRGYHQTSLERISLVATLLSHQQSFVSRLGDQIVQIDRKVAESTAMVRQCERRLKLDLMQVAALDALCDKEAVNDQVQSARSEQSEQDEIARMQQQLHNRGFAFEGAGGV
ncbi:MAG: hypothetical protein V3U76_08085 [Granulosicoccus sp.]